MSWQVTKTLHSYMYIYIYKYPVNSIIYKWEEIDRLLLNDKNVSVIKPLFQCIKKIHI